MKTKTLMTSAVLAGALMACGTAVNANPMLELISGSFTTVVTQTGASGSITYSGAAGQWSINVTTGENVLGVPTLPDIDVSSLDTAPKGSFTLPLASLTILYSAGGNFGSGPVVGTIGGTTTTSVSDYQYMGDSAFSTSTLLTALGAFSANAGQTLAFSGTATGSIGAVTGTYWLTEKIVIGGLSANSTATSASTSFDANSQVVPDGATTMTLLGSAFAGLGLLRSRFGKRA